MTSKSHSETRSISDEWATDGPTRVAVDEAALKAASGAVPQTRQAYLLGAFGSVAGKRFVVERSLLIGRDKTADVVLSSADVSRQHARVMRAAGGDFVLEDLDSVNGTYVNGHGVRMHVLRFGDTIQTGSETGFIFTHHNPVEDQVIASERIQGASELASGMAHHFNNAMAVMVSSLTYLRDLPRSTTLGDIGVQECLADLEAAIWRSSSVVRQMSSFARRGKYTDRLVNISALVEDVGRMARAQALDAAVSVDCEKELYVRGDASQLHEMLANLCRNSLDALQTGGRLALAARCREISARERASCRSVLSPGPHVVVTVTDSGAGMDTPTRDQAFQPFFSTKGPTRGTGLGLSAVLGVVESHGGHVRIDSSIGCGTTVWIYLPMSSTAAPREPQPTASKEHPMILVGEGDDSLRSALSEQLEGLGFRVVQAASGRDVVLRYLENQANVRLIVLDCRIPGLGGPETHRILRAFRPGLRVLVTGPTESTQIADKMVHAGARAFVKKPYDVIALSDMIGKAVAG